MTIAEALREGIAVLRAAGIDGAARDARLMMAAALGAAPERLILREREALPLAESRRFEAMVAARAARRPVAQILGRRRFWGRDFAVSEAVLDPRPETETLVAAALAAPAARRVLDLGTGSGAILLTLLAEWPGATGTGIDVCEAALAVARRNAVALGVAERAVLRRGTWVDGLAERFDLVVCNPPYIPAAEIDVLAPEVREWEPRLALSPGPTGLEAYRDLAVALSPVLAVQGRALFEFGAGQEGAVRAIFGAQGWQLGRLYDDLDGRPRVLEALHPARSAAGG